MMDFWLFLKTKLRTNLDTIPWFYSRVFLTLFTVFILFELCLLVFDNSNMMPGVMLIGSLIMPFTILTMYFELNINRDLSFYKVITIFLLGGATSLLLTLFLYQIIPFEDDFNIAGASLISLIEELGKAIIIIIIIKRQKNVTMLQGLLIGGAIGCGFAVFESAGYAFNVFLNTHDYNTKSRVLNIILQSEWYGYEDSIGEMNLNICIRALLAFGGHTAWAGIEGFAFSEKQKISINFLVAIFVCFVLHALWDLQTDFVYIKLILLCFISWHIILYQIAKYIVINNQLEDK